MSNYTSRKSLPRLQNEEVTSMSPSRGRVTGTWPALARKSPGLFIFASTLARLIKSEHHEPTERCQLIVTSPDSTVHEGGAGIDLLYTQALKLAFSGVETTAFVNSRRVLGAVVLAFNSLSREQISGILGISASLITTTLQASMFNVQRLTPSILGFSRSDRIFEGDPDFPQIIPRLSARFPPLFRLQIPH